MECRHPCTKNTVSPSGHHEPNSNIDLLCIADDHAIANEPHYDPRRVAAGEKDWGDVPYLPSYKQNEQTNRTNALKQLDNLFFRGPFYQGLSETHESFTNRGGLSKKKHHKLVRHYEEPGLRYDQSITQTDFIPPYNYEGTAFAVSTEDEYVPKKSKAKNPHLKEYVYPRLSSSSADLYLVEKEPERDFLTEHLDNYVCYQKSKGKPLLRDLDEKREVFLDYVRETHEDCPIGYPRFRDLKDQLKDMSKSGYWQLCDEDEGSKRNYLILPSKSCLI